MGRMLRRQLQLVLVLVRSLRRVESGHCRRPFLLIGALPPIKSVWRSRFDREGVILSPTQGVWGKTCTDTYAVFFHLGGAEGWLAGLEGGFTADKGVKQPLFIFFQVIA